MNKLGFTAHRLLISEVPDIGRCLVEIRPQLKLLPNSIDIEADDLLEAKKLNRELLLRRQLKPILPEFDVVLIDTPPAIRAATVNALEMSEEEFQRFLEQLEDALKNLGAELSDLARALLTNHTGQLEKLLREAAQGANLQDIQRSFQEGQFANAVAQRLGFGRLAQEVAALKEALQRAGLSPQQVEQLSAYLDRRLQDLAHMVRSFVRAELEKQDPQLRDQQKMRSLADKSFYYLTEDEIRKMKEAVAKLAQRLKHVIAIRRKRAKRGRFDLQQTLRKNLQYGGVPFKIVLDTKKKEKPQVVILCDVSDSVRNVSRFMLQFVHSVQSPGCLRTMRSMPPSISRSVVRLLISTPTRILAGRFAPFTVSTCRASINGQP